MNINKVDTEAGVDAAAKASSGSGSGGNSGDRQAKVVATKNAAVKPGGGSYPTGDESKNFFRNTNKTPPIILNKNKVDTEAGEDATAKASSGGGSRNKNERKRQRKKEKLERARVAAEATIEADEKARGAPFRDLLTEFMPSADADFVWHAAAGKVLCAFEEIEPFFGVIEGASRRLGPVQAALLKFLPAKTVEKLLVPQLWGPKWLMLEVVHSLLCGASADERELRLTEVDALWTYWNGMTTEVPAMPASNHEAATPRPHDYVEVHAELAGLMSETTATQLMAKWYGHAGMLSEAAKLLGNNEDVLEAIEDIWIARSDDDNYWAEDRYGAQDRGGWDSGGGDSDDFGGFLDGFEPFG